MAKDAILVTGCAGLIGSQMCRYILENYPEYEVVGVDNLSDGYASNVPDGVIACWRSVCDPLDDLFNRYNFKYVFHFAARAAESMSGFNRVYFHEQNIIGSANVINNCINFKVNKIIFASSMSVYGDNPTPFSEDQTPNPIDPYGNGKYMVELDLRAAYLQHGLNYAIFRGHSIYGPGQSLWDKYRNVIGIWMKAALDGKPYTIYGDGLQKRAFTYIDDILPALWLCATSDQANRQVYNFGNDHEVTLLELLDVVKSVTGHTDTVHLPPIFEVHNAYCSHDKAKTELDLHCPTDLFAGVSKMWEWAKEQPEREVKIWDRFEVKEGLYDMWKR